jgi:hypothetical protein
MGIALETVVALWVGGGALRGSTGPVKKSSLEEVSAGADYRPTGK